MKDSSKIYRRVYSRYISEVSASYHNMAQIAKGYKHAYYLWKPYLEPHFSRLDKSKVRVLDIGSGLGHQLYFFTQSGFKHVEGLDISSENVAFVSKLGYNIKKSDIRVFLKNKKSVYGIISFFDIIEHFTKKEAVEVLQLIRQALEPGGMLIMQTLNGAHPFFGKNFYWDITHENAYTLQSLKEILSLAGWKNNTIFSINGFHTYHPNLFIRLARKAILGGIASVVERMHITLARAQGIVLLECKPTLISISYK